MAFRHWSLDDPKYGDRRDTDWMPVGPSKTQQSDAHEADINVIVGRYMKTGDASVFQQRIGAFEDVSEIGDYADVFRRLDEARSVFELLPAKVREYFGNDPGQLIAAIDDPSRVEELVGLGVFEAPKPPEAKTAFPEVPKPPEAKTAP